MVWCNRWAPATEKEPVSDYLKLLFERGHAHESWVVSQRWPDAKALVYVDDEAGFAAALEEAVSGVRALRGAPLFWLEEQLMGKPDLLLRVEGRSALGDWAYEVVEIKSSKNIEARHILQTAFYNYLIGKIQRSMPQRFHIINRDNEMLSFEFSDYSSQLATALSEIAQIYDGKIKPELDAVDWPWKSYARKLAEAAHDILLIAGIGRSKRARLRKAGILTIEDLAAVPESLSVEGIGPERLTHFKLAATAKLSGRHILLSKPELPRAATEIFLDIEGTDEMLIDGKVIQVDYLVGTLVRSREQQFYKPFFARRFDQEGEVFVSFLRFLAELRSPVIFHYGSYERVHLERLFEKYDVKPELRDQLGRAMFDLLPVIKNCLVMPTPSNSIKDIGRYIGFVWRQGEEVDAQASIALYIRYQQNRDERMLKRIIDYNEDDCRATVAVVDWLRSLAK